MDKATTTTIMIIPHPLGNVKHLLLQKMYARMNTGINIQLSPQQLEMLQRGEEISFSISLEQDVERQKIDIFRSGNPPPTLVEGQTMFLEFFRQ